MDSRKSQFLKAILGEDGAKALEKAAARVPELEAAIFPRAVMAWLGVTSRSDFEGQIPGVDNTYFQFSKNEGRFSGSVAVGEEVYSFDSASLLHLGACVAVALGADHERLSPELRDLDIQRLGKNIDTLAKARVAIDELRKRVLDPAAGISFQHEHHDLGGVGDLTHVRAIHPQGHTVGEAVFEHQANGTLKPADVTVHPDFRRQGIASAIYGHAQKVTGKTVAPSPAQTNMGQALWQGNAQQKQFGKAAKNPSGGQEPPGPAAAPTPQQAPLAPQLPQPSQTSKGPIVSLRPKPPKLPTPTASTDQVQTGPGTGAPKTTKAKPLAPKNPTLKVSKAEADAECPVCGGKQFKGQKFSGCLCFADLAKSVTVTVLDDGYSLAFKPDWDQDSILTLLESFGKN